MKFKKINLSFRNQKNSKINYKIKVLKKAKYNL